MILHWKNKKILILTLNMVLYPNKKQKKRRLISARFSFCYLKSQDFRIVRNSSKNTSTIFASGEPEITFVAVPFKNINSFHWWWWLWFIAAAEQYRCPLFIMWYISVHSSYRTPYLSKTSHSSGLGNPTFQKSCNFLIMLITRLVLNEYFILFQFCVFQALI